MTLDYKSRLILTLYGDPGDLVTDYRLEQSILSFYLDSLFVVLQEGRTCVGREDATNEQDIGKIVLSKTLLRIGHSGVMELLWLQWEGLVNFID